MPRCSSMYASMQLADAYNYDSTFAAEPWQHQAAEPWKHASSRTMEACKQQITNCHHVSVVRSAIRPAQLSRLSNGL